MSKSDEEHLRRKELERGQQAAFLLEHEIFNDALETLKDTLREGWEATAVTQEEEREKIYHMLVFAKQFENELRSIIQTGKFASQQLEDMRNGRTRTVN